VRVVHRHGECTKPHVALTFDDGPDPARTPEVLAVLAEQDAVATFCVIGEKVAAHPETARAVAQAGHLVVNHSWDHVSFAKQDAAATVRSVARTAEALTALGLDDGRLVRPPYGDTDPGVERALRGAGWHQLLWTVNPEDWHGRRSGRIVRHVARRLRPDAIVLLHDGAASASGTLAAVEPIVRAGRERGYCWGVPAVYDRR
jgi:peptidoglycan-N-acetylglucosamine deacetylase